jgi:ABC-type multidrug transport system permease subunit
LIRFLVKAGAIVSSLLTVLCLAGAAALYYKSSDPVVVREGDYLLYQDLTIILAAVGVILLSSAIGLVVAAIVLHFQKAPKA